MQQGFIKLHRKIQEHWIYQEKRKFSRYEAWLDMLMMANHKSNKFILGNQLVEVEKGSFITSEMKLMKKWDWGKAKLRTFLEMLENDGMIVKKSDRQKTTIIICNYCIYHSYEEENRPQADYEQTAGGLRADTNKNVKNEKNVKKKDYTSKIIDLSSRYTSVSNFNKLAKEYWDVIRETRATGKVSESVIYNTMSKWTKYDPVIVQYALKTHIEAHAGKKEGYTIGIMRGTTKEEAEDRLNSKVIPFSRQSTKKQEPTGRAIPNDFQFDINAGEN